MFARMRHTNVIATAGEPPMPPTTAVPSETSFRLGVRSGLGISAMRGHKALQLTSTPYAIKVEPAFSLGAGIAFAIEMSSSFALALEPQYTWYRANGELAQKNGADFPELNEAGASLHAFELPVLLRIGSDFYAEAGPQVGYNYYAKVYKNSEFKKPQTNALAFGPSLGFGIKMGNALIGLRGHFGLLEYAENTNGYPWAAQVSVTQFFF